jgi:hypothetical protein
LSVLSCLSISLLACCWAWSSGELAPQPIPQKIYFDSLSSFFIFLKARKKPKFNNPPKFDHEAEESQRTRSQRGNRLRHGSERLFGYPHCEAASGTGILGELYCPR